MDIFLVNYSTAGSILPSSSWSSTGMSCGACIDCRAFVGGPVSALVAEPLGLFASLPLVELLLAAWVLFLKLRSRATFLATSCSSIRVDVETPIRFSIPRRRFSFKDLTKISFVTEVWRLSNASLCLLFFSNVLINVSMSIPPCFMSCSSMKIRFFSLREQSLSCQLHGLHPGVMQSNTAFAHIFTDLPLCRVHQS